MTIRLAKNSDTLSITKIWRECFTDDSLIIENFINNCFPYSKTWLLTPTDSVNPVAILSLLPSYAIPENTIIDGGYVYGVATLPKFRGRGYSSLLMERAIKFSKDSGFDYIVVKPASESLFELYQKQSFDTTIVKTTTKIGTKDWSFDIQNLSEQTCISVGEKIISDYNLYSLREAELSNSHLLWPKDILTYTIKDAIIKGGDAVIHLNNDRKRALYYIYYPIDEHGETIKIAECNAKIATEIYPFINFVRESLPSVKFITIEGDSRGYPDLEFITERSAMIKQIGEFSIKTLETLHLSLPME